jgi:hypothetical protein
MDKIRFSRKSFLNSSLLASSLVIIPNFLNILGADSIEEINFAKQDPIGFAKYKGIENPIHQIILAGITAPNSHNTQPWKFRILSDSSFELYADGERQLLPIDPLNRQLYHTQGTFLEFASLAANILGYEMEIQYFPKGEVKSSQFNQYPIAKITILTKNSNLQNENDLKLFSALPKRQMNRGKYEGEYLTEQDVLKINGLSSPKVCSLVYGLGKEKVDDLLPIFKDSFASEISYPSKNDVSRFWFRISKEAIYTKRDGITLEGNGLTQPILWIAKTFFMDMSPEGWNSESSLKQSNDSFSDSISTSKGLVFFVTKGSDTAIDWLNVGRDFARFTLAAAKEGFAFHTMNQAFVDSEESIHFQNQFKSKLKIPPSSVIQLAGRLGRADLSFVSPRRELTEFIT